MAVALLVRRSALGLKKGAVPAIDWRILFSVTESACESESRDKELLLSGDCDFTKNDELLVKIEKNHINRFEVIFSGQTELIKNGR